MFTQVALVTQRLNRGDQVSQAEIKGAVQWAIQLHRNFPTFNSDVMLAIALGNHRFHRAGTESELMITSDEEFADNLRQLQTWAARVLQTEIEHIPDTDHYGKRRDESDIEADTRIAKHRILVVSDYLSQIIAQASPNKI